MDETPGNSSSFHETIIEAAKNGNLTSDFINSNRDIMEFALQEASASGHTEIIQAFLNLGMNITTSYALHNASKNGHLDSVQLLIGHGADVNLKDGTGETPLHLASIHDHVDVVKLLLDSGANLEANDDQGRTALYAAAESGHSEVLQALIEAGAEVGARGSAHNRTAAYVAVQNGHEVALGVLLEAADVPLWLTGTEGEVTGLMRPWPEGRLAIEEAVGVDWDGA